MQKSLMKLTTLFKLKQTKLIQQVEAQVEDQKQQMEETNSIGGGLLAALKRPNIQELSDQTVDGQEKRNKKSKKKKRKANQADLEAVFTKSRNQLAPLKIEKIQRVRANEINQLDGSRILPELPAYLQGFVQDSKTDISPERTQEELKLQTVDSVEDRLYVMRKLTARMNQQDSPGKSLTKSKTNLSHQSGATEAQTQLEAPESYITGLRDADSQHLRVPNLAVYKEDDSVVDQVKKKLDFNENEFTSGVNVVRGGGGQAASQEIKVEKEARERMRPLQGLRHELKGDQVIEVYADKKRNQDSMGDNDLIITIFDDEDDFVPKAASRVKSDIRRPQNSKVNGQIQARVTQGEQSQVEITESFKTDPSMVDYDSNGEGEENIPQRQNKIGSVAVQKKQRVERNDEEIGDGIGSGLNFHPQITPGLIFDTSKSDSSNDQSQMESYRSSQSSGRDSALVPQIEQFDFNDRTRN